MSNGFLVFNENKQNMLSDADYAANSQRENGVVPGIASPALHNKLFHQVSMMCAAFGQFLSNAGQNVSDASFSALVSAITTVLKIPTGVGLDYWGTTVPSGWILAFGTIGNASSGATNRANADTQALFTLLWNSSTNATLQLYDSSGNPVARGASAALDFAANRAISVPDVRGRVRAGLDNMGGVAAGRLVANASVGSFNGNVIAAAGGESAHTQTIDELVSHNHSSSNFFRQTSGTAGNGSTNGRFTTTTNNTGGGQPFNIVQPTIVCNYIIKL